MPRQNILKKAEYICAQSREELARLSYDERDELLNDFWRPMLMHRKKSKGKEHEPSPYENAAFYILRSIPYPKGLEEYDIAQTRKISNIFHDSVGDVISSCLHRRIGEMVHLTKRLTKDAVIETLGKNAAKHLKMRFNFFCLGECEYNKTPAYFMNAISKNPPYIWYNFGMKLPGTSLLQYIIHEIAHYEQGRILNGHMKTSSEVLRFLKFGEKHRLKNPPKRFYYVASIERQARYRDRIFPDILKKNIRSEENVLAHVLGEKDCPGHFELSIKIFNELAKQLFDPNQTNDDLEGFESDDLLSRVVRAKAFNRKI